MPEQKESTALVPAALPVAQTNTIKPYRIHPDAPRGTLTRHFFLSDSAFKNGIHVVGGPGSGKSRLLGRFLGWQVWQRGYPVVVLDPTGGVIQNILDKVRRLPMAVRKRLWSRLCYVDVGATDYIFPAPLYYRQGAGDTLFAIANRFPAVLKRQDPQLQSAPILGWNSLFECAIFAGQIAVALERQLDFVADLLAQPKAYKSELRQVLEQHPDLTPAVNYFRELMDPSSSGLREKRTGSFTNKLLPFLSDPTMLAAFAAPKRGIDWAQVIANGQLVLIDFQTERDPERRQFKLLWWFRDFVEFIKHRGMAGRGREVFLLIDEVTQLLGYRGVEGNSMLADDLEELIAVLARNYGVNVVIAHQNLSQVEERIRNVLMQMGTQMIGVVASPDDALYLARQFHRYQPYAVKKWEPVWMNAIPDDGYAIQARPMIIDQRAVEFSSDEQLLLAAQRFQQLGRFEFMLRPALSEGNVNGRLQRISIAKLDAGQYPDVAEIAPLQAYLRQKWGTPLAQLLTEIQQRQANTGTAAAPEPGKQKQLQGQTSPAILNVAVAQPEDAVVTTPPDSSVPATCATGVGEPANRREEQHDDFWA